MTDMHSGPVEELKWTDRLQANVVTPGPRPRIHGYDIRGEMLGRVSFSEMVFLALTGELPSGSVHAAFDQALLFLAPVSVAEAPVHASVLSGLCGSGSSGLAGVTAITLAEQARWTVSKHSELLRSLSGDGSVSLDSFGPETEEEKRETLLLLGALRKAGVDFPKEFSSLSPVAASLAVLHECCGLADPGLLETVLLIARMPCTLAEGRAVKPGNFRTYPIDIPEFKYSDEKH